MTEHDLALLERLRAERSSATVEADDPAAVARALVADGARALPVEQVPAWTDEATVLRARADAVRAAEEVVARTRAHERAREAALLSEGVEAPAPAQGGAPAPEPYEDGPDADRRALRFSLTILGLAQVGGTAVYLADGTVAAVAVPAAALVAVLAVAALHRRPGVPDGQGGGDGRDGRDGTVAAPEHPGADRAGPAAPAPEPWPPAVPDPPAVLAAEAHLRRQQAAWKLAWWARDLPPVPVERWLGSPAAEPATLVVADPAGDVAPKALATMTAAVPAAVRVVLIRSRPA